MKNSAVFLATLALLCWSGAAAAQAGKPVHSAAVEGLEKSKAKAEHASERDRCFANTEVVHDLVPVATEQFNAGDADQGQKTVGEMVDYADRAREAAQHSNHKLKQAEITLRKAQRRLDDLRHTLAFEDQEPVEAALKKIEADRQEILRLVMLH